ncbi:MAG: alpha/beta hydrolase-fold protein [Saprospiraceae bacterium]
MKKKVSRFNVNHVIAFTLILAILQSSCKKEEFSPSLTSEFEVQSKANGATYKIKVGLPENYKKGDGRYASIYVLDGEENFDFVSKQCKEISGKLGVPNVVVISIGYGHDRSIDYTPTKVSSMTGGGPLFINFIETELIPLVEDNIDVDTSRSSRVILGHSYGGLFGTYAFTNRNKLFGNYILLSPSLWFDDLITLQFEKENREENKGISQLVFMGIGEAENFGRMQAPFEAFYQILRDHYAPIRLEKNNEKNLGHRGSEDPNIIKGLAFYFKNR